MTKARDLANLLDANGDVKSANLDNVPAGGVAGISSNADATAITITSDEKIGIGETSPLGQLHVKTADSGTSSAAANYDEIVIENSDHAGMSILTGTDKVGAVRFGDSGDNDIGGLIYNHADNSFTIKNNATNNLVIDANGHITKPSQPAVHAYIDTIQSNISTGITTVQLNAEIYDVNSDFNPSNYTFTAPVTGKYLVTMNLVLYDFDNSFQWLYVLGVASNRNYYLNQIDPRLLSQDGIWSLNASSLVDMDANDTFQMKVRTSSHGAAQMDIQSGNASATETTMTMTLLS